MKDKNGGTEAEKVAAATASQKTIVQYSQDINKSQKLALIKKFQLAHFLTVHNKSFHFYQELAHFEKDYHNVQLGSGYLSKDAAQEILQYTSNSILEENVTLSLNSGKHCYFSLLFDGSSSAKAMDEKEVYVVKTCANGIPQFEVLALEQPSDTSAMGLKSSLDNAVSKGKFTFDRKSKEIGLGSDGTNTNKALYQLEKEIVGEHLVSIRCISHKLELAVHDAFKRSKLNSDAEEQLQTVYYLFRRANLKWRLFKKHANALEIKYHRFKRPGGTPWVEHQVTALNTFLYNLHNLLRVLNDEIALPYKQTTKKERTRLEGILKQCQSLEVLLFQSIKVDLLQIIKPTSKGLESIKILLPEAVTIAENTLQQYRDLLKKAQ